jgi:hypothetical protein
MNISDRVFWTQVVGIFVLLGGIFGFNVDAETQAQLIGGLSAIGLVLTMLIAKWRGGGSGGNQSGFATPESLALLLGVCFFAVIVLMLPGCASAPKPLNTIASVSTAIEQVSLQIDLAQKSGQISNEREDALQDELKRINGQLRLAVPLTGDAQSVDLKSINDQLIALRAELAKGQRQ